MKRPRPTRLAPPATLLAGVIRLAFFNPSGFAAIGSTAQAFLASLAPLVAFTLVGAAFEGVGTGWRVGLAAGLQSLCVVLGQPVVSHQLARWAGRSAEWPRYATAVNWCQLVTPLVAVGFFLLAMVTGGAAASAQALTMGVLGGVVLYSAALNLFLAWRGLALSFWRATAFALAVPLAVALMLTPSTAWRMLHATPADHLPSLPL